MSKDIYCPMIHGGIHINLKKEDDSLFFNQCCLSTSKLEIPSSAIPFWQGEKLQSIRSTNNENIWLDECWQCRHIEAAGLKSFRQSMLEHFGVQKNLTGPLRIDFLFDRSCNLACRTCGPHSSTFWEKHLVDNNLLIKTNFKKPDNIETIKNLLESLDLSNLEQVQFCGGETLLGNTYWDTAQMIADLVPQSKTKLLVGFQTNGTQPVPAKYHALIEKFKLVKFMISLDGTHDRFEYLRWPANWSQVVDNICNIRATAPGNVMFYIQETTSCLNLFYFGEVNNWVKENFNSNRSGDLTDYGTQLALHNYLNVNNITQEYFDAIQGTKMSEFISPNWKENPDKITEFIRETEKFDKLQGQDWKKTFPDVARFYSRYFK
jgi:organic radical activating enzyme